jgi:Amt family ammonium transporter
MILMHRFQCLGRLLLVLGLVVLIGGAEGFGQVEPTAPPADDRTASDPLTVETAAETAADAAPADAPHRPWLDSGVDSGSTAWLLVSSAFVLLMLPGLALFYGGMVRAKNVLNMFLSVMACCGVIGVLWVLVGYAMAFPVVDNTNALAWDSKGADGSIRSIVGYEGSLIGLNSFSEINPKLEDGSDNPNYIGRQIASGDTVGFKPTGVPELAFVIFQGMFAIITPALIVGAVAERIRFFPLLIFLCVWSLVVYAPVAHTVWNVNGLFFQKGVMDFAGGTVVHVLAGVSALALCLVTGPRRGWGRTPMPPHSLGLTLIGAGLLWFGWFGFNAGSAIAIPQSEHPVAGVVAAIAFGATQIAAATAGLAWMLVEWIKDGKPTILGFASGVVAGLVAITPCAGHVNPMGALIIGALGGTVCYFGCQLKRVLKYDDSLDAFGVHGVGGFLGACLVGIFAIRPVTGSFDVFTNQLQAVCIAAGYAFAISFGLAYLLKSTIGLRPSEQDEIDGLDIAEHGESGYNLSVTA